MTAGTPDAEAVALAAEIAEKANALAQGGNASILDTLARVLFMKGERAKAIAVQEKALAGAGLPHRREYQNTLDSYRAGKLPSAE